MTSFLLKIIGIISMFCDHFGDAIIGKFSFLNLIGRIAFPLFAYQMVQGYMHTKNLKNYISKMFIFACISQIPFMLFQSTYNAPFTLNIFFTFFIALITLHIYDECKNPLFRFFVVFYICILAELIHVDYGAFGILLIFIFYFFENNFKEKKFINIPLNKILLTISTIILCFGRYIFDIIDYPNYIRHFLACGLFTSLALIFILLFNGKEGKKLKYLFYVFYPLHLLILYLIHTFCL